MKKVDQYKVITVNRANGKAVIRSRKSLISAIGDALDALERGAKSVRLEGVEGFVDFTLLSRALRGRPLSVPCYGGADLDIGGSFWSLLEDDFAPAVVDVKTGAIRFYHSPEECMVAVARFIFMPEDDIGWELISG